MPVPAVLRHAACLALALLLTACGGGGSGGSSASSLATGSALTSGGDATALAGICTTDGQKAWLRSWMGANYLWADRMPAVDPAATGTPGDYFDALLIHTPDSQGLLTDRFSMYMPVADADAMEGLATASAATAPQGAVNPVPLVRTVSSPAGRRVGYILFNDHSRGAQDALIDAFASLKAQAVQDLVLDLRYNPGGYLYVARTAAAMVAGPSIAGQVFETATYNAQRSTAGQDETYRFGTTVQQAETRYPLGTALPQLGLGKVYVLASALTCSASESIVNSLRGVGVDVVLVGSPSCGKPYGFHRQDNCGTAWYPIEFRMANAAGQSVPTSGLAPQCPVAESPTAALGDPAEPLLAAALQHADTGRCPVTAQSLAAGTAQAGGLPSFARDGAPDRQSPAYRAGFDGRRLLP